MEDCLFPPSSNTAPPSTPSSLEEEKALIREYCIGGDVVVRWPDGDIGVYDATGNPNIRIAIQRALNEWNAVIASGGGKTRFYLSNNPNSPVKVFYDPSLSADLCASANHVEEGYEIISFELRITTSRDLECDFPNTYYAILLKGFGHMVGMNYQKTCPGGLAPDDSCPYEAWIQYTSIPDIHKKAIRALYKFPLGYNLVEEMLPQTEITDVNIDDVKGVVWNPGYQTTKYPFFLIDYCGRGLLGPPMSDRDYKYPQELQSDFVVSGQLRFILVILGEGFGNTKGRVQLEGKGMISGKPQSFIINEDDILYWTDNKIIIYPHFDDPRFEPMQQNNTQLRVERGDGSGSASFGVSIAPSIGRQPYGQCTWWTNLRLIEEKGVIRCWTGAYEKETMIDITYKPWVGDILAWDKEHHQVFVEEVFPNGMIKISQYNQGYREDYSEYITGYEYASDGRRCYQFSDQSSCANKYIRH